MSDDEQELEVRWQTETAQPQQQQEQQRGTTGKEGRHSEQGALGTQVLCAARTTSAHCDRIVCRFGFFLLCVSAGAAV
jgi:hypothetical protein